MPPATPPPTSPKKLTTPARPAKPTTYGYFLYVRTGGVYAVEMRDGWIPARALGPFAGEQLRDDPAAMDWSAAAPATEWNTTQMVGLCERERARKIAGVRRTTSLSRSTGRVPIGFASATSPDPSDLHRRTTRALADPTA